MERLTKHVKNEKDDYACIQECEKGCVHGWLKSEAGCRCEKFGELLVRLCQIEDILGDTYDLDRLRELVEADKVGLCVVIPDFVWKIGETRGAIKVRYRPWMGRFIGTKFYRTEKEAAEAALAKEADRRSIEKAYKEREHRENQ